MKHRLGELFFLKREGSKLIQNLEIHTLMQQDK